MNSTLFVTIAFTVVIVVVPQLVAEYFNNPRKSERKQ